MNRIECPKDRVRCRVGGQVADRRGQFPQIAARPEGVELAPGVGETPLGYAASVPESEKGAGRFDKGETGGDQGGRGGDASFDFRCCPALEYSP